MGRGIDTGSGGASYRTGLVCALTTAFAWGLAGIFVKLLHGMPPLLIVGMRLALSLGFVLPLLLRPTWRIPTLAGIRNSVTWGLGGLLLLYYLCAVAAFQRAPVAEVALFISTAPVFVLALQRLSGHTVAPRQLGGVGIALGGIAVVMAPGLLGGQTTSSRTATEHLIGLLLALMSAALSAGYAALYRNVATRGVAPDGLAVALATFLLGSVGMLGLLPTTDAFQQLQTASTPHWLALAGLALVSTVVPTLTYSVAARLLPSVVTAATGLLIPVCAAIAAYLVLREPISATLLPGAVLVLAGLYLLVTNRSPNK